MLDNKTYSAGMVKLSEFFRKGESLSKLFLDTYYQAIKELTNAQFERAIKHLIKTHTSHFFPVPAELLQAVADTREQIQITDESNQIEPRYVQCPKNVKEQMNKLLSRFKRGGSISNDL